MPFLDGVKHGVVQPKLKIGPANDKYEVEADQMADRVMRMPAPEQNTNPKNIKQETVQRKTKSLDTSEKEEEVTVPNIQRKTSLNFAGGGSGRDKGSSLGSFSLRNRVTSIQRMAAGKKKPVDHISSDQDELKIQRYKHTDRGRGPPTSDFSSKLNQSKGSGKSMDNRTQSFMSSRFGADFSNVKIHTGTNASKMNDDIQAKAFTHQNHVYFNKGQYQPHTWSGKKLLAHELTHTIQQGAVNDNVQRKLKVNSANDRYEQEADAMAEKVMRKCKKCASGRKSNDPQFNEDKETNMPLTTAIQRSKKKKEIEKPQEVINLKGGFTISDEMIAWLWSQKRRRGNIEVKYGTYAKGSIEVRVVSKRSKLVSTTGKYQGLVLNVPYLNLFKRFGIVPAAALRLRKNVLTGYVSTMSEGALNSGPQDIFNWIRENAPKVGLKGIEILQGFSGDTIASTLNEQGFSLSITAIPVKVAGFIDGTLSMSMKNSVFDFSIDADVNVPLLEPTSFHLERDRSGKLSGEITTGFNIAKLNGTVNVKYNEGKVDIKGDIHYQDEQFDGRITVMLTDYETAMNLAFSQLEPQEIASMSKVITESNKEGQRALVGYGTVDFTLNEHFKGKVKVIVDGEGHVTVIGKLSQESEIPLFDPIKPKKKYKKSLLDYKIRYGIPLLASIGIGVNLGLFADWGVQPGTLRNLFIEGVYSTNPKLRNNRYTIGGNLNVSAFAEAGIVVSVYGFGELLGHEVKVGLALSASAKVEGYLDAGIILGSRATETNPEKNEYFINGTVVMAAQPSIGLSSEFFVELDSPWWSPVPDDKWTWPLSEHYFPVAEDLGLQMDIEHIIGSKSLPTVNFEPHSFDPAFFMDSITEDLDSLKGDNGDKEMNSEFKDKRKKGKGKKKKRGKKNRKEKAQDKPSKYELAAFEKAIKKADDMDTTFGSMGVDRAQRQIAQLKRMSYVQNVKLFKHKGTKHFVYLETKKTNNRQMKRPVYWDVDRNNVFGSKDDLGKQDLQIRRKKVKELENVYLQANQNIAPGVLFEKQVEFVQGSYKSRFKLDGFEFKKHGTKWSYQFGQREWNLSAFKPGKFDRDGSTRMTGRAKQPKWRDFIENKGRVKKSFVDAGGHGHDVYFKMKGRRIDMQMASANPGDIEPKIKKELAGPSAGSPAEKASLKVALKQVKSFESKMVAIVKNPVPKDSVETQNLINLGNSGLTVAINLMQSGKYGDEPKRKEEPKDQEKPKTPEQEPKKPEKPKVDPPKPVKPTPKPPKKTDPDKGKPNKSSDPKPTPDKVEPPKPPKKAEPTKPKEKPPLDEKKEEIIENPVSAETAHRLSSISRQLNITTYSTKSINIPGGHSNTVGIRMRTHYLTNHPSKLRQGSDHTSRVQKNIYGYKKLPTRGAFGRGGGYKQSMVYIKGHLLNGNVGGPAVGKNLYPISGQANSDHKNGPEKWVKRNVLSNKYLVYYGVSVTGRTNPTLIDVKGDGTCLYYYMNSNYDCSYATYRLYNSGRLVRNNVHHVPIRSRFDVAGFKSLVEQRGCPQRKARRSVSSDKYERQADLTADRIMRKPLSKGERISKSDNLISSLQRKTWDKEEEYNPYATIQRSESNGAKTPAVGRKFEGAIRGSKGNGRPLDKSTRRFMENRFGNDFGRVNIHTGSRAADLSNQIDARAFTIGNDIYFNQGQYNPKSDTGKRLLAHELTHTIQQGAAGQRVQRVPDDTREDVGAIRDFGIIYNENKSEVTMFSGPEYESSDSNSQLPIGTKVLVFGREGGFYSVALYSDSSVTGYIAQEDLVQAMMDDDGDLTVENDVHVIDQDTFDTNYPGLARDIATLYWDYHDVGGFVESLRMPEGYDDPTYYSVAEMSYWSSLRFEKGRRRMIESRNDYSAKNILIWLDAMDSVIRKMVALLAIERNGRGSNAQEAVYRLDYIRNVISPGIEFMLGHSYLDAGEQYMDRESILRVIEDLEYEQQSPAEKALPTIIEFLRSNRATNEIQAEYNAYGALLAQLLSSTQHIENLNKYGFGLSAEGIREVFLLLQQESPALAEQALYRGETIGWLVSQGNMSGFADFRASGEGLLSGLKRGYYEEMNTTAPAPFDEWGGVDAATFYLWYTLGVPSGFALGAKDLVVGLYSLFTPAFWKEMYRIFTDEAHRYEMGVGLGTAMAKEIRTYQSGDPATVGWKLGVLTGRIGFEVVFTLLTSGAFQLSKVGWAAKFPRLARVAEAIASTKVAQIAASGASFIIGKLDDIARTVRGLIGRLPPLTAAQRMNRHIIALERELDILLEAAEATKALAQADNLEQAASGIARLEEQTAQMEGRLAEVIDMVEGADGVWRPAGDDLIPAGRMDGPSMRPAESPSVRQIEGPVSNPEPTVGASVLDESGATSSGGRTSYWDDRSGTGVSKIDENPGPTRTLEDLEPDPIVTTKPEPSPAAELFEPLPPKNEMVLFDGDTISGPVPQTPDAKLIAGAVDETPVVIPKEKVPATTTVHTADGPVTVTVPEEVIPVRRRGVRAETPAKPVDDVVPQSHVETGSTREDILDVLGQETGHGSPGTKTRRDGTQRQMSAAEADRVAGEHRVSLDDLRSKERRAKVSDSHDMGVEQGIAKAQSDGIVRVNWDNPESYLGLYGRGIDDVGRDGMKWVVLEWKGGPGAKLATGQMSDAWVGRKLAELEHLNDPMAATLLDAAKKGQLEGRVYTTLADDVTSLTSFYQYNYAQIYAAYLKRLAEL